jgi:predicted transcriptional regulator
MPGSAFAGRVERDVKAVHGDVHALLNAGILQKTEDGRIVFPFAPAGRGRGQAPPLHKTP